MSPDCIQMMWTLQCIKLNSNLINNLKYDCVEYGGICCELRLLTLAHASQLHRCSKTNILIWIGLHLFYSIFEFCLEFQMNHLLKTLLHNRLPMPFLMFKRFAMHSQWPSINQFQSFDPYQWQCNAIKINWLQNDWKWKCFTTTK